MNVRLNTYNKKKNDLKQRQPYSTLLAMVSSHSACLSDRNEQKTGFVNIDETENQIMTAQTIRTIHS